VALGAADGRVQWRTPIMNIASKNLLVTERRIYMPEDPFLSVFDRVTGRYLVRVRQSTDRDGFSSLIATAGVEADGEVYFGVYRGLWSFNEP
jgi:outer membrane protein assembly factor BamB